MFDGDYKGMQRTATLQLRRFKFVNFIGKFTANLLVN